ncbi:MAG TPA: response regulator [Anaerolineae bacterium]|mgnify:CR=1 FL=1|nr:response regulator [Anaerolineae bacterium]HQH38217.1 response regulator [Anaerolineae bacterium]
MNEKFGLVIEDEEDLATIFSEALKASGFQTEIIYDGLMAQQRLTKVCPDVVILDLNLPHVDGNQLLNQIRADPRLEKTRVLVVTADAAMANMLDSEADLTLLKPVSFIQLRTMAERIGMAEN